MNAAQVIQSARKNIGGNMEFSARLCLEDAIRLYDAGDFDGAKRRAIKSLGYSVGILHPAHQAASK